MATNGRIFSGNDISTDTGEVNCTGLSFSPGTNPPQDTSEQVVSMRLRIKTHTASVVGQFLVSVRWNDGVSDQSWDVSLNNTAAAYTEVGQDIWADASRNVTVQVRPLVAGGSVDVRLLGVF